VRSHSLTVPKSGPENYRPNTDTYDASGPGLFLGIFKSEGGYRQMFGGGVNIREAQIYI